MKFKLGDKVWFGHVEYEVEDYDVGTDPINDGIAEKHAVSTKRDALRKIRSDALALVEEMESRIAALDAGTESA